MHWIQWINLEDSGVVLVPSVLQEPPRPRRGTGAADQMYFVCLVDGEKWQHVNFRILIFSRSVWRSFIPGRSVPVFPPVRVFSCRFGCLDTCLSVSLRLFMGEMKYSCIHTVEKLGEQYVKIK